MAANPDWLTPPVTLTVDEPGQAFHNLDLTPAVIEAAVRWGTHYDPAKGVWRIRPATGHATVYSDGGTLGGNPAWDALKEQEGRTVRVAAEMDGYPHRLWYGRLRPHRGSLLRPEETTVWGLTSWHDDAYTAAVRWRNYTARPLSIVLSGAIVGALRRVGSAGVGARQRVAGDNPQIGIYYHQGTLAELVNELGKVAGLAPYESNEGHIGYDPCLPPVPTAVTRATMHRDRSDIMGESYYGPWSLEADSPELTVNASQQLNPSVINVPLTSRHRQGDQYERTVIYRLNYADNVLAVRDYEATTNTLNATVTIANQWPHSQGDILELRVTNPNPVTVGVDIDGTPIVQTGLETYTATAGALPQVGAPSHPDTNLIKTAPWTADIPAGTLPAQQLLWRSMLQAANARSEHVTLAFHLWAPSLPAVPQAALSGLERLIVPLGQGRQVSYVAEMRRLEWGIGRDPLLFVEGATRGGALTTTPTAANTATWGTSNWGDGKVWA